MAKDLPKTLKYLLAKGAVSNVRATMMEGYYKQDEV